MELTLDMNEIDVTLASPESQALKAYDDEFFDRYKSDPPPVEKSAAEHMADASIGLALFAEETMHALRKVDLTVEQRLHAATILSYIEALSERFDRVRTRVSAPNQRT